MSDRLQGKSIVRGAEKEMQEWEGSGQVPSLLAERAAWEGPRSMRAVEGSLGHPLQ